MHVWARIACAPPTAELAGWPIAHDDLVPHYDTVERSSAWPPCR